MLQEKEIQYLIKKFEDMSRYHRIEYHYLYDALYKEAIQPLYRNKDIDHIKSLYNEVKKRLNINEMLLTNKEKNKLHKIFGDYQIQMYGGASYGKYYLNFDYYRCVDIVKLKQIIKSYEVEEEMDFNSDGSEIYTYDLNEIL